MCKIWRFYYQNYQCTQLYTDDTYDNNNDNDNNANDDDNDTQWTNHDCIGSLACMPIEPKSVNIPYSYLRLIYVQVLIEQNKDMSCELKW